MKLKEKEQVRAVGTLAARQTSQAALVKQVAQRRQMWQKEQTQRLERQEEHEQAFEEEAAAQRSLLEAYEEGVLSEPSKLWGNYAKNLVG